VLIDWFTVAAQIVNFLILALLLRRFLYGPIVKAMDEREARILRENEAAEQAQAKARSAQAEFERKQAELAEARDALMRQAQEEAEARRHDLVKQARQDADQLRERWQQSVANERDAFLKDLRRHAGQAALDLSRRTLADLADQPLEDHMAAAFAQHLDQLPDQNWQQLLQEPPLTLVSAHELPPAGQERIRALVKERDDGVPLRFEVDPDLVGGLELRSPTHKIPWTLTAYLDEMEARFVQALDGGS
jgi:F-type H+-transporting ATPase subunit b